MARREAWVARREAWVARQAAWVARREARVARREARVARREARVALQGRAALGPRGRRVVRDRGGHGVHPRTGGRRYQARTPSTACTIEMAAPAGAVLVDVNGNVQVGVPVTLAVGSDNRGYLAGTYDADPAAAIAGALPTTTVLTQGDSGLIAAETGPRRLLNSRLSIDPAGVLHLVGNGRINDRGIYFYTQDAEGWSPEAVPLEAASCGAVGVASSAVFPRTDAPFSSIADRSGCGSRRARHLAHGPTRRHPFRPTRPSSSITSTASPHLLGGLTESDVDWQPGTGTRMLQLSEYASDPGAVAFGDGEVAAAGKTNAGFRVLVPYAAGVHHERLLPYKDSTIDNSNHESVWLAGLAAADDGASAGSPITSDVLSKTRRHWKSSSPWFRGSRRCRRRFAGAASSLARTPHRRFCKLSALA